MDLRMTQENHRRRKNMKVTGREVHHQPQELRLVKNTVSPEAKEPTNKPDIEKSNTLSGVLLPNIPVADTALNLTGIPDLTNPDTLPDLINSRLG